MTHLPFQYGTTRNFLGIKNYTTEPFVVLGAPVDCATTFRSGARLGPNAIRDVSMMLTDGVHPQYTVDLKEFVGDAGDIPIPSGNTDSALSIIEKEYSTFLSEDKHVVTLGGDHSITYAILRALRKKYGKIAVVHFDAHCDTWPMHFGEFHGHGTWLSYSIDDMLVDPTHTISIGVRSPADIEARNFLEDRGGTTISARQAMKWSPQHVSNIISSKVGDLPVYLSLDIDCLDPAYAPGTGTPEIGGLSTIWLSEVIENLQTINWIGMDCVEVSPAYDHSQITSLAAATFVWQYLSMNAYKI
jgi:agmatinase